MTKVDRFQSAPYGMLKDSALQLTGNERFEGFGIDLIHELSLMLGFNYVFRLQEDGSYGSINNVTKEWNGMIRELLDEVHWSVLRNAEKNISIKFHPFSIL